jgi:hypothetical protein
MYFRWPIDEGYSKVVRRYGRAGIIEIEFTAFDTRRNGDSHAFKHESAA